MLVARGVDADMFGRGEARTLAQLAKELGSGQCTLRERPRGRAATAAAAAPRAVVVRCVTCVALRVRHADRELVEIRGGGGRADREEPLLAEKVLRGEGWRDAAAVRRARARRAPRRVRRRRERRDARGGEPAASRRS